MSSDLGNFNNRVLLTGAGFSRNYGGWLASEIWEHLVSQREIMGNDRLRELLLSDNSEQNFEKALNIATSNDSFSAEDVNVLVSATCRVFVSQDANMRGETVSTTPSSFDNSAVRKFVRRFDYGGVYPGGSGYIFTLNQDLLLERKLWGFGDFRRPVLPGVPCHEDWFTEQFDRGGTNNADPQFLNPDGLPVDFVRTIEAEHPIPVGGWPPKLAGQFNYLKLHGSFDWRDQTGRSLLVVGGGKRELINGVPLLAWYADIFRKVCEAGGVRLFISGYSFSDAHINETIAGAASSHGLRVFLHNTSSAREMRQHLLAPDCAPYGREIWNALIGYCSRPLGEIFPDTMRRTAEADEFDRTFFD